MTKRTNRPSVLAALRLPRPQSAERRLPPRHQLALALALGGLSTVGAVILVRTAPPAGGNDGALTQLVVALVLLSLLALCDVWTVVVLTTGIRLRLSIWTLIIALASITGARLTLAPGAAALAGTMHREGDRLIVPGDLGPSVLVLSGRLRPDSKGAVEVGIRAGDRLVSAALATRHERGPLGLRQVEITVTEAVTFITLPGLAQARPLELVRLSGPIDGAIAVVVFERVLPLWIAIAASLALLVLTAFFAGPPRLVLFASALSISLITTAVAALTVPPGSPVRSALGPLLLGLLVGVLVGPASRRLSRTLRRSQSSSAADERARSHGHQRRPPGQRPRAAPEDEQT